jgi:folate-binding protein YgfZ
MPTLRDLLSSLGATLLPWGADHAWIPDTFGAPEAEYAALRRHVGILPCGHRGLVRVTGKDAGDLLNRVASNKLADLAEGQTRRAFVLDGDGHIRFDFTALGGEGGAVFLDTDANDAAALAKVVNDRVFAEDCAAADLSAAWSRFLLAGPAAHRLLSLLSGQDLAELAPWQAKTLTLGGEECRVFRHDQTGSPNLHLWVPAAIASPLFHAMLEAAGFDPEQPLDADTANLRRAGLRGRPIGWDAFNTARIESGTALFHLDFGPDSLPAECGKVTFAEAVHLQKGCYPGQEAVARMHNLGHPKRILVKLKCAQLPPAGAQVVEADEAKRASAARGGQVGGITGSTLSPMLGAAPLALAVVKWGKHAVGAKVAVEAGGAFAAAEVVA